MAPVASLTKIPEPQLDRLIRRIGVILLAGALVFAGFYLFDRWRPPAPTIVDREIARHVQIGRPADQAGFASSRHRIPSRGDWNSGPPRSTWGPVKWTSFSPSRGPPTGC